MNILTFGVVVVDVVVVLKKTTTTKTNNFRCRQFLKVLFKIVKIVRNVSGVYLFTQCRCIKTCVAFISLPPLWRENVSFPGYPSPCHDKSKVI